MTATRDAEDPRTRPSFDWSIVLDELRLQMVRATYNTHLADSTLVSAEGDELVVAVRTERSVEWCQNRLAEMVARTASIFAERPVTVRFVVAGNGTGAPPTQSAAAESSADKSPVVSQDGRGFFSDGNTSDYEPSLPDVGAGQVGIAKKRRKNPAGIFLQVPHYALRFWRPLIGAVPFALYEALNHYHDMVYYYSEKWPTISAIVETIGQGTRHTILGRGPTGDRPAQKGAVDVLVEHRLAYFWTTGQGPGTRYYFKVFPIEDIEVLTPKQLSQLSKLKQKQHRDWLPRFPLFDVEAWQKDTRETRIPAGWWNE